jgi:hypothetical protein
MRDPVRFLLGLLLLVVGLAIGFGIGFVATTPSKVDMPRVTVSKEVLNDRDALVVDSSEHNPLVQQQIMSVEIDHQRKTISILRYHVLLNPSLGRMIDTRWPIVIRSLFFTGEYTLQVWRAGQFVPIGRVTVVDEKMSYVDLQDNPK